MATLTIPVGVVTGDVMIIAVSYKNSTTAATINTPAGWSVLAGPTTGPNAIGQQGAIYSKTATGTDAGSTLTVNTTVASQQINVAFSSYSGASGIRSSSWVAGSATASTSVTCTAPGTAPQAGDLVVLVGSARENASGPASTPAFTAPSGATIRAQSAGTSGSAQNVAAFIGDHDNTAGDRTVTASVVSWSVAGQVVVQGTTQNLSSDTSESLTSADTNSRLVAQPRSVDGNALTSADAMGASGGRPRAYGEALGLGDAEALARVWGRADAESVQAADAMGRSGGRPRAYGEAMNLGDAGIAVRAQGRATAESTQIADSWARQSAGIRAIAEALGLGHALTRGATGYARATAETISIANVQAATGTRARGTAESTTLADSPATLLTRGRGVAESVQSLDVPTRLVARPRAQAESATLADTVARSIARSTSTSEALTVADTMARARSNLTGSANTVTTSDAWGYTSGRAVGSANTAGLVDAVDRGLALARAAAESVALGHVVFTGRGVMLAVGEALGVADSWARAAGRVRGWSEFIAFDDHLSTVMAYVRGGGETVHLDDTPQVGRVVLTAAADVVDLEDVAGRSVAGGVATAEALGVTNTLGRLVARGRGDAEALTLGQAFLSGQYVTVSIAQSLSIADVVARNATTYVRLAPQSLTLADSAARGAIAYARSVAQPVTLADTWQTGRVLFIGIAEAVQLVDVAALSVAYGRSAAETVVLGHTIARSAIARSRGIADVFGLSTTAQSGRILTPSASEQVQISDVLGRAQGGGRGMAEAVALGHALARLIARGRGAGEAVQLVDGLLAQREIIPVAFAEEIAFSDSAGAKVGRSRGSANSAGLADTSARTINRARALPDTLLLADLIRAVRGQSVVADVQPMTLDDIGRAATSRSLAIAETVLLFSTAGAGDSNGNPIVIAHSTRVRMTKGPHGRVTMTRLPGGGVRMTGGG